jgi:HEPN domain-containing protein
MTSLDNWVDEFISNSFRDVADEDYIGARLAYRHELLEPFLWLSLQAVEKYLKAMLLFHRKNTKPFGHDVVAAFSEVRGIPGVTFPADIEVFIDYVNDEGPNRYSEYPSTLREDSLIGLDRTVWHLRRYCYPIPRVSKAFADRVAAFGSNPLEYRHKFSIDGAYLEKVLAKPSAKRRELVWKNFWFGSRRRRRIARFPSRLAWRQPVHFMRPEVFAVVEPLVRFDKGVKTHFASQKANTP